MPSWRSTALNRPIFCRYLKLFLVNFQRSWNCFLVNVMSAKLKAFSILAKKIREVYLGWSAGRCSQFLAISSLALFTAISSHFYAWCPILTTFFTPRICFVFSGHQPTFLLKKNAKLQIMGCDSIQQCNYIQICFWGENKVFQEIIFEQTSHIYCKYRKMYAIHCCYLSYFPSTSPGTATRPSPASVHGLMGQRGRKSKNESGLPHPLPLPPASAYITVWTPVQVESLRLDLARRYLLQSLSEGTPQGQPVYLGMNENKGVRRIVFSITS